MAGYAASSRLQGAVPRFAGASPTVRGAALAAAEVAVREAGRAGYLATEEPVGDQPMADQVELVGRPLDASIRDWLASIGESWSQLTFYLFDSESWR